MTDVKRTAAAAFHAGLVVIPPREDGTKAPDAGDDGEWAQWRTSPPDVEQLRAWYRNGRSGVGITTDRAHLFDFDDQATYEAFRDTAEALGLGELVARVEAGYHELTPDDGHHWLFYCETPLRGRRLAGRPGSDPETGKPKIDTLIEIKGVGGYAVIAPSHGLVHPSGRPYRLVSGGIGTIVTLTTAEWEALRDLAIAFDEVPKREYRAAGEPPPAKPGDLELRPGDDFNQRGSWRELLVPHGWRQVGRRGEIEYWRRPGKDHGISATINGPGVGPDRLYVFSTSTALPEANRSYTKFQAFAFLEYDGDFPAATRKLGLDGYGEQRPPASKGARVRAPKAQAPAQPTDDAAAEPDDADEPAAEHTPRPAIDAGDLELRRVAAQTWKALVTANDPPFLFRYSGIPARVEANDDEPPLIRPLTEDRLRHVLARIINWHKLVKVGGGFERRAALPPIHVVRDMLAAPTQPLPPLTGIIEAPAFAPDGSLHERPGYHAAGRTWYAPAPGFALPAVPARPSATEIERARGLIVDELLGDFPFVDAAERAHAIALLLLPFVRGLIDGPTPLHLIEKPSPGTGASLLADVLTWPAIGRTTPTMTEGRDEDEWRKRLTARIAAGASVVLIDNLRGQLDSAAVASAITSTVWSDRILGKTENVQMPVRCTWIATGNNPALSSEITRRTIRIRLNAQTDRPWLRTQFRHPNLRGWAQEHRGELVWAALTLARAWIAAGRPAPDGPTLGMFESWTRVIGGVLLAAEIPGFLSNLSQFYDESDSEGAEIRAFLAAWWEKKQAGTVTVAELFPIATSPEITLDISSKSEQGSRQRLGRLLRSLKDRHYQISDDLTLCIRATGKRDNSTSWRLDGYGPRGIDGETPALNPQQQAILENGEGLAGFSVPRTHEKRGSPLFYREAVGDSPETPETPRNPVEPDDEPDF